LMRAMSSPSSTVSSCGLVSVFLTEDAASIVLLPISY
jgi:hypothetical protein